MIMIRVGGWKFEDVVGNGGVDEEGGSELGCG